ncbi:MAG: hypothetical protein IKU48_01305 [Clostridia bacterium]|nr:hypothetical protein [Clostridia bacterium]
MFSNITLPTLEEISDKNNAEKIRGYLATLHDQLRYMMLNIDTDNLSDGLKNTITDASENAEFSKNGVTELKESIVSHANSLSSITQTADKINWLIKDGTNSSDFSLTSRTASLISSCIDLTGYVKFNDLAQSGSTTINGSNIITGSLSADKISVGDLSALSASIGGWTLNPSGLTTTASGYGSLSLNSALSSDSYWLKATNANGYTTFYIAKNGSCYFNGSYISNGSISANKIISDTDNRLDLTNNYNGIKLGSSIHILNGSVTRRIFINPAGVLTFDTGSGNTMFSLALTREGSNYTLSVLNGSGQTVGNISL